ncbi:hypothetical protein BAN20980_02644 [Burkholderia anthina]|uniref:Uncharacterized protein n=1 Tax=Burkholderia anthina TaxID=179879 RepID=A0A6P2G8Q3_9BURK|nr:hypothetical protein BAN20980_02644 [Burkholderia anthina]
MLVSDRLGRFLLAGTDDVDGIAGTAFPIAADGGFTVW